MSLQVLSASPFTTVQDLGRTAYQRFGVPISGAMDWFAHRAANALVKNDPNCALIEIGLGEAEFLVHEACVAAVCGASVNLTVHDHSRATWTAIYLRKGWRFKVEVLASGSWAYVAISGGIHTPSWLGSRSTYPRANLGRALQPTDHLPFKLTPSFNLDHIGRTLPMEKRPAYQQNEVQVILGPQQDHFTPNSVETFLTTPYRLTPFSDRMGYRLEGVALQHRASADIISDGMVLGAIQVPVNGQPIVMMSDHATTGGYPKIATVITADIPLVAQHLSAQGELRFKEVSVEEAQEKYRALIRNINFGIVEVEET